MADLMLKKTLMLLGRPDVKKNMWALGFEPTTYSFTKRNKLILRKAQNMKTSRASVSPEVINEFYDNLETTIKDIPPENIVNYDETNLSDDPGIKKVLCRKGMKRVTRIIDSSKSSVSIMWSVTASGKCLPPYVVYRATHLHDTWCEGGPAGTYYNRTKSGWFESDTFEDWLDKVPLRYFKQLEGEKVIIGDNLSTHLSPHIIELCMRHSIKLVFLPANSTAFLQPLDVSVFGPMKKLWRQRLEQWNVSDKTLPKTEFSEQLKLFVDSMESTIMNNIKSGFRKSGIYPLSRENALRAKWISEALSV